MGDPKYGRKDINLHASKMGVTTQLLHAYKLKFSNMPEHLSNLEGKTVEAPLPQEFNRVKKLILAEHN
jgi:23S rRNA pseudouridine955/2504/2580 synthase